MAGQFSWVKASYLIPKREFLVHKEDIFKKKEMFNLESYR
jgi:hypothetical protein